MEKTNAMRILERAKIGYTVHTYEGGALSGVEVAKALGQDPACTFKTLVTVGSPRKSTSLSFPWRRSWTSKRRRRRRGRSPLR